MIKTNMIMRKIVLIVLLGWFGMLGIKAQVDTSVRLTIREGVDGPAKTAIERSLSDLLTEINQAYLEKRALNLVSLNMTDAARDGLAAMWENVRFYCDDAEVVQNCLLKGLNGYQIRQIPLMMKPTDGSTSQDDEFQEGVANFSASGQITRFNVSLATTSYLSVVSRGTDVTDVRRREEILSYVEHFRTAYEEKDLAFMNQIFSDDALIITGTVIKSKKTDGKSITLDHDVVFHSKTKQEYLASLKQSFASNSYIRVKFDEIKVVKHPTLTDFYGVTVHQLYSNSSGYSDDGYVFMLWDFRDKNEVRIHVRAWTPKYYDKAKTQEVPVEKIPSIGDFKLDL